MDEKVKLFVESLEKELTAEDIDTHLEGCIGCDNCGHACAWYLVTNDSKYHPRLRSNIVRKIYRRYLTTEGKILGKLGLIETPTDKYLEESMSLFWESCTTCGRCSLACMQGVSNRRITQLARTAFVAAGIMPNIIKEIRENSIEHHHSYGLTFEESAGKIISAASKEEVTIPIDNVGADYLWTCSAIANSNIPEEIVAVAKLLNVADVDYTVSSILMDTGTEVQTTVVDPIIGRQFIERIEGEARRLRFNGMLGTECGCDVRTYCIDASKILGREFELSIAYLDSLLLDMIKKGKVPIEKLDMRVTLHDPCWIGRLTGYFDESRELLKRCVTDFVEMTPNREHNYCCNGGAGSRRMWPIEKPEGNLRHEVSVLKAKQIEQTKADYVVAPCTTCYLTLRDIISFYNLKTEAGMVVGIVCMAMEKAIENCEDDEMKNLLIYKMKTPINMRDNEK